MVKLKIIDSSPTPPTPGFVSVLSTKIAICTDFAHSLMKKMFIYYNNYMTFLVAKS